MHQRASVAVVIQGVGGGFGRGGYKAGVDRPQLREDILICGVAIVVSSINMVLNMGYL